MPDTPKGNSDRQIPKAPHHALQGVNTGRIMVVDDDVVILRVIQLYLTRQGFECHTYTDSRQALEIAPNLAPNLILLDYLMPGLNGFELCRILKQDPRFIHVPVVFITSLEDNESIVGAFDAGAVDYIVKPVNTRELLVRIKTHLELASSRMKLQSFAMEMETLAEERAKQLIHADRLATLGVLSAGVAHEINNPTTFISGNIQTLEKFWEVVLPVVSNAIASEHEETVRLEFIRTEMPDLLNGMKNGVQRIQKIVNSLRQFARKEVLKKSCFDVRSSLENALELCKNAIKKSQTKVEIVQPEEDVHLFGDSQQIEQILVNLIVNAADSLTGRQEPTLKIIVITLGERVEIRAEDNGPGVPAELLEKIWMPFFTTKEPGKGTGLGLSISRSIARSHEGDLRVENLDTGARFTLDLPLADKNPRSGQRRACGTSPQQPSQTD